MLAGVVVGLLLLVAAGHRLVTQVPEDDRGVRPASAAGERDAAHAGPARARREERRRVQKYPDVADAWEQARRHFEAGEWVAGLALLAAARRAGRRFLDDDERQKGLAAAEEGALAAIEALLRRREKEAGLRAADALEPVLMDPARRERLAELRTRLAALREPVGAEEVVARAVEPEDRAQLERHLRRFAGRDAGGEPARADWVDALLARVAARAAVRARGSTRGDAGSGKPLPVADEDAAEARRIEQLEKLRQREAIGLLDHIHAGLAWLALHQAADGRVSADTAVERCRQLGHEPCTKVKKDGYELASTALAVLAFLDFRDQDRRGLFEPSLSAGVDWLLAQQKADGSFPHVRGYTPGIVLMALGQAASSSGRADVRRALQAGLEYYAKHVGPDGGYRYGLGAPGDLSVTGWYVQALEAARDAGVEARPGLIADLRRFVESCRSGDRGWGYRAGQKPRASLQAVGMLSELILDPREIRPPEGGGPPSPEQERLDRWRADLARRPSVLPESQLARTINPSLGGSLYSLYYEVRVQLALDGKLSEGRRQRVFLLADRYQVDEGGRAGVFEQRSGWISRFGPTVETAFCVLTLEHALYRR